MKCLNDNCDNDERLKMIEVKILKNYGRRILSKPFEKKKKKKYVDIREARCYIKKKIKFLEYYVQRYMYMCVHSLFKVISSR